MLPSTDFMLTSRDLMLTSINSADISPGVAEISSVNH